MIFNPIKLNEINSFIELQMNIRFIYNEYVQIENNFIANVCDKICENISIN